MISGWKLTNAIYDNIAATYHPGMNTYVHKYSDKDKKAVEHVIMVTMDIVSQIAATVLQTGNRGEYERGHIFSLIHNQIWTWYPGGTTAANCAGKICDELGIDWPKDENF